MVLRWPSPFLSGREPRTFAGLEGLLQNRCRSHHQRPVRCSSVISHQRLRLSIRHALLRQVPRKALLFSFVAGTGVSGVAGQGTGSAAPGVDTSGADSSPRIESQASTRPYERTDRITWVVLGFSALHHLDHVLRANHSGWPFTSKVTPFTYSLAIYPIVGAGCALDAGPATFIALDAAGTVGLLLAHSLLEPPQDQYDPWVDGSNRLGVRAPALGRLAQGLSIGLSVALAIHLGSSIADGLEHGFLWQRAAPGRGKASLSVGVPAPTPEGAWTWGAAVHW